MDLHHVTVNAGVAGAQEQVEEMLLRDAPFHLIEAFIHSADLEPDAKAALWLLAWSEQSQPRRRAIIRDVLMAIARPQG
jgi:hypothetical protein